MNIRSKLHLSIWLPSGATWEAAYGTTFLPSQIPELLVADAQKLLALADELRELPLASRTLSALLRGENTLDSTSR